MYSLGVDLGTVRTAAATWRDGHAEIVPLGSRTAAVPSVVLLRPDASFLTGEAAHRRALIEPSRVAREFKRRLGDATPIMLGGAPHSPEALTARLLSSVVADVTAQQGEPPVQLCVCHPADWGPFKTDLLQQAVRMADLDVPVTLAVEPVAAAAHYARHERLPAGSLVAVYDLGGGTFDAAVVRTTGDGSFEIVGHPEGIEHLGGADFDAAVLAHIRSVVGDALADLDDARPGAIAAVARLREECTSAKETLSSDTDTTIPVALPALTTEVRLTRAELERLIRPALHDTVLALQRAVRSAGISSADLHSVLLVGGSSRIPLVAQMVGAALDRPVAVDSHPEHAVALGAACLAAAEQEPRPAPVRPAPVRVAASLSAEPASTVSTASTAPSSVTGHGKALAGPSWARVRSRSGLVAAAAAAAVVALVAVVVLLVRDDGGGPLTRPGLAAAARRSTSGTAAKGAAATSDEMTPEALTSGASGPAAAVAAAPPGPLYACPTAADAARWSCLLSATLRNGTVSYRVRSNFQPMDVDDAAHYHLHFYLANLAAGGTRTAPLDSAMQVGQTMGTWYNVYSAASPNTLDRTELGGRRQALDPRRFTLLCVRVASGLHGLATDRKGKHHTGNCARLTP